MKKTSRKAKLYLGLQIVFAILTFVGFILILMHKLNNAGMSIICMVFSLMFGNLYRNSKNEQNKK